MKILVVGCGSIGRRHAVNARNFADVSLTDIDSNTLGKASNDLGIRGFKTLEDALSNHPDAVVVATPHHNHLEVSSAAINAGSHVLIEKPISNSLDGVENLLTLAKKQDRRVHVVCNMRFHPGVSAIRDHLADVGHVYFARAQYGNWLPSMRPGADYSQLYCARKETGGGVILDAIHEIDYLQWLLGPADSTMCHADKLSNLDVDVEDYAAIVLVHTGGAKSEIHLDYLQKIKMRGCVIAGEHGTLIWQSEGKKPEKCTVRFYKESTAQFTTLVDLDDVDLNEPYRKMMESFVASVSGKDIPDLLGGKEALIDLKVALAAKLFSEKHRTMKIDNFGENR
ncbi:MAG: Gfo/Idh/MocA family oxidoreductase [Proteobacteria bacterium]|nr:Gfo/Idh/MocA family oxidoreductase [Pseudomonadota bacterium]MBU1738777.1 Gfo/Idh/MocA family oxidoreductase [Pseudomonadota bacterium]